MKFLLVALVYYLDPETKTVELMWQDVIPQESMEECQKTGARYKTIIEDVDRLELQYFCKPIETT